MKVNKYKHLLKFAVLLVFFFISIELLARAGGGGGSDSGGGDGGGLVELIFYLLLSLPFPYNIISVLILIFIIIIFNKKLKQNSVLNKIPSVQNLKSNNSYLNFKEKNPDFIDEYFKRKVDIAFFNIQYAWMSQNTGKIRKFISDGVYQRFNVQFIMMKKLKQRNELSNIKLHSITIIDYKSDGQYDVIDVALHSSMNDKFICEKMPQLNQNVSESFVEYWSFIKKSGFTSYDIYENTNCPQCGAAIPELEGEVAICPYCKATINSGDFDWVLSEITQADDYTYSTARAHKQANLHQKIANIHAVDPFFSVQKLEDKASNAFLQYSIAEALRNPLLVRRFMQKEAYDDFEESVKSSPAILYNRLYLNDVSLISAWDESDFDYLGFYVRKSYQRIQMKQDNPEEIDSIKDPVVRTSSFVIVLCRKKGAKPPKGMLYTHQCPNCGGTLSDSTDIKCPYCDSELNSPDFEWVVENVYTLGKYKERISNNASDNILSFNIDKADDLLDVRDYAFNNTLIIMASDGDFSYEEELFAKELAKKLKYNPSKINSAIELAKNKKLVLRMPDDSKKHPKIIRLMEKAAMADEKMTESEKEILNYVKSNF